MNKMDWDLLKEEIKNKTEEEIANEMETLYAQFPIGGEFVKQRMGSASRYNYRLLREFLNCDYSKEWESILPNVVLFKNGKEIKIGDPIYSYNTRWVIFLGVYENWNHEYKPLILSLNRGIGCNSDRLSIGSANDTGECDAYEYKKKDEIPTDLHYADMRGYKGKCAELDKKIKNGLKYDEDKRRFYSEFGHTFSYEELANRFNWEWDINNGSSDSWYGDCCTTDKYTRVTLNTGYFKYSDKFINDTYGYRY